VRIAGFVVDGFGPLSGFEATGLEDRDLVVVVGPNESGKSTLREFVATALYGFAPANREDNPWVPPAGRLGGRLTLVGPDGEAFTVYRELQSRPKGVVHRPGVHEQLGNRPLPEAAAVPRAVYLDLMSLDLDAVRRLSPEAWRAVEDRLLSGSALGSLRSASRVRAELDREAAELWRADNRGKPRSRELRERLRERRAAQRDALASSRRLDEVEAELAALAARARDLRERAAALAVRRDRHVRLAPALAAAREVARLRAAADALLPDDDLPEAPLEAMERRTDAVRAAEERCRDADAAVARAEALVAAGDAAAPLAERAGEVRLLAAGPENGTTEAARLAERLREASARADARALAVLGRPLAAEDEDALASVRPAELRAAVAHAAAAPPAPPPRRPLVPLAAAAAVAFALLAAVGAGGRLVPGIAAAVFALLAVFAAGRRQRAASHADAGAAVRAALGELAVDPARIARPDPSLVQDVEALADAVALLRVARADQDVVRDHGAARASRVAGLLAEIGAADLAAAATLVEAAVAAADRGREAAAALPAARERADEAAGRLIEALEERNHLTRRLVALAGDGTVAAGAAAVREARRLRAAADERTRAAAASGDFDARVAEAEALERRGERLDLSEDERAALEAGSEELRSALDRVERDTGRLEQERRTLAAQPGAADVAGEIAALEELQAQTLARRDRLALTASVIAVAERRYRETHGPAFLRAASDHLSAITAGRYVRLDQEPQERGEPRLVVLRAGDPHPVPVEPPLLSRGALEQVYVALRLALLDEVDPERALPVFLDEALVNWDAARVGGLLPLLAALGGRQVFVATCHPALAERLAEAGAATIETPRPLPAAAAGD
jgi:uncharacterized protein YhaN